MGRVVDNMSFSLFWGHLLEGRTEVFFEAFQNTHIAAILAEGAMV